MSCCFRSLIIHSDVCLNKVTRVARRCTHGDGGDYYYRLCGFMTKSNFGTQNKQDGGLNELHFLYIRTPQLLKYTLLFL